MQFINYYPHVFSVPNAVYLLFFTYLKLWSFSANLRIFTFSLLQQNCLTERVNALFSSASS